MLLKSLTECADRYKCQVPIFLNIKYFLFQQYEQLLNIPKAFDILVAQAKLPPIQAIFITPPNDQERPKELTLNPEFSKFFSEELLLWIDTHVPNKHNPQNPVLLDSSLEGYFRNLSYWGAEFKIPSS
ncbi:hypothetical protein AY606_07555 [Acinetobacter sp. SFB]|uniref:hypothetical protein n=1 Tax=Acinetobacter sp. SFB TaxID=1805634 RepID=UPI0007D796B6|nr:hypothetical protein [Acinetobacter sp. SFB]OAL79267.1 hypothetical protein AY606_07555 [Acinetobacter sp. SFB]